MILAAISLAIVIVVVGTFFFIRSRVVMEYQLKEKLRNIAAVSALQFHGDEIMQLQGKDSMGTPLFEDTVYRLNQIRRNVPAIRFVYIMKPTANPNQLEFVADADSLLTPEELDVNGNGVVDRNEKASYPGDLYDVSSLPALRTEAFLHPTVDQEVTYDSWGSAISGYAPIWDEKGKAVAVLGIDMDAEDYFELSQSIFSPFAYLLLVLACMFLGGYMLLAFWQRKISTLEELDRERYTFMSLALHQLGAPLATFRWWLEILADPQSDEAQKKEVSGEMTQGVDRMNGILEALKMANKVWKGDIPFEPQSVNICEIVQKEVQATEPERAERKQTIETQCPTDIPMVTVDPKLIASVVHELLSNASSYSAVETKINISVTTKGHMVEVHVKDVGIGFTSAELAQVFQKFMRGERAVKMKPVGNGLGLFIARGILLKAKGTISVQSEEGKGTTVTISVPVTPHIQA